MISVKPSGAPCVLIRTTLHGAQDFLGILHVYALLAPHIGGYGAGNDCGDRNRARELMTRILNGTDAEMVRAGAAPQRQPSPKNNSSVSINPE